MMRATTLLASLSATCLVACATPAHRAVPHDAASASSSAQDQLTPSSLEAHALPGARAVADHLLAFLSTLDSTSELKPEPLGRAFGVTLKPDTTNGPGWAVYHSPDLGQGWTYWVQQHDARPSMKNGFRFQFDHPDRMADAAPVCALTLDRLRKTLTTHGWVEQPVPSEIGSVVSLDFSKGDVVLTLALRDRADVHGIACVLAIQTSDGH